MTTVIASHYIAHGRKYTALQYAQCAAFLRAVREYQAPSQPFATLFTTGPLRFINRRLQPARADLTSTVQLDQIVDLFCHVCSLRGLAPVSDVALTIIPAPQLEFLSFGVRMTAKQFVRCYQFVTDTLET